MHCPGNPELPLDENQVCEAVATWLKGRGFENLKVLHTTQKGIDIEARRGDETWLIEAKGGTSSVKTSPGFGKPYTATQVFDRVAKAWYTAGELRETHPISTILIAFPDTPLFRKYAGKIKTALSDLGLGILWVASDKSVTRA